MKIVEISETTLLHQIFDTLCNTGIIKISGTTISHSDQYTMRNMVLENSGTTFTLCPIEADIGIIEILRTNIITPIVLLYYVIQGLEKTQKQYSYKQYLLHDVVWGL